ncbi:MAG TPA: hypothetical protein VLK25_06335 [Allosphingosinicella sp.]|nr:hypothetical protein [Allosphingosinicella sp.]
MTTNEPRAARPMFSTQDFSLLREAVAAYARELGDDPRSAQLVSLHHRLGRSGRS